MVAMTAQPGPRLRPTRDPARAVGAWVPVLLVAAGVLLSLLGWATGQRVDAALESAQRNATAASTEARAADLADVRAQTSANEAAGLAALIVQRCDDGWITDRQVCETARKIQR